MRKRSSFILLVLLAGTSFGQKIDSTILDERMFLKQALDFAPKVKNSALKISIREQEWVQTRAAFEPKFKTDYGAKQFDGKTYYSKLDGGVKVQTPLGIKLGGGYAQSSGLFLNPEENLPQNGLVYAGIEVPLGAGLFTDPERTNVRLSKLEQNISQLTFTLDANDYLLDAGVVFWKWYGSIEQYKISLEARELASARLKQIKQALAIGEAAAVDTLEAFINFQNRQGQLLKSEISLFKQTQYIQNYLWNPDMKGKPMAPLVDTGYQAVYMDSSRQIELVRTHPILRVLEVDSVQNNVKASLAREYLKPRINMEFKLQETPNSVSSLSFNPGNNNYVGLNVSMPLLLRKERSKIREYRFKNEVIRNQRDELYVKLLNSQEIAHNNSQLLSNSAELWKKASTNYRLILDAELTRFQFGESSLFVVNNRELKWLDARFKYIESYVNYRIEVLNYYHSLGMLTEVLN